MAALIEEVIKDGFVVMFLASNGNITLMIRLVGLCAG
jgi:hypothetical protein